MQTVTRFRFRDMDDVRRANADAGLYFFSPGALRFFSSRVSARCIVAADGRAYFVTSEQFRSTRGNGPRLYTVRVADPETGRIDDVGGFQWHETARSAWAAAAKAAAGS